MNEWLEFGLGGVVQFVVTTSAVYFGALLALKNARKNREEELELKEKYAAYKKIMGVLFRIVYTLSHSESFIVFSIYPIMPKDNSEAALNKLVSTIQALVDEILDIMSQYLLISSADRDRLASLRYKLVRLSVEVELAANKYKNGNVDAGTIRQVSQEFKRMADEICDEAKVAACALTEAQTVPGLEMPFDLAHE